MKHAALFFSALAFTLIYSIIPAAAEIENANAQPFDSWLDDFKRDAQTDGISEDTLRQAFADVEILDRVIELDRKQPETTLTLKQYLKKVVTPARIEKGREKMETYHDLLESIGKEYAVEPEYIAALWGIETNFGGNTGNYSIVSALTTLAYDGRRSDFFRAELLKVLHISEDDHIPPADIKGSWAGAMGQCQFMPSSFLNFAVDHDKDGKRDIWNSEEDVFASIANYLHESGWKKGGGWKNHSHTLHKWNRSDYFAAAVRQLARDLAAHK